MMLPLAAFITIALGVEIWASLIASAVIFAVTGAQLGLYEWRLLSALPLRLLGILDNDLLQALPMYGWLGMLLQYSGISRRLHRVLNFLFRKAADTQALVTLSMGLLLAPMIGSVASTARLLSSVAKNDAVGSAAEPGAAYELASLSAASTLGLTLPPSLVLLLFGDAMMTAHTMASNQTNGAVLPHQILNTQDVFRLMLVPGALVMLGWILLSQFAAGRRHGPSPTVATPSLADWIQSLGFILSLGTLLTLVGTGQVVAVEAAAIGCSLLVLALLFTRALDAQTWRKTIEKSLMLTGSLMGLLIGATTLSLALKLWAADQWIDQLIVTSKLAPLVISMLLLLVLMVCAWVMDAFELIFVVIPVLGPSLMRSLGDASQASVIMMLVLQTAFLLPPFGYAVLFSRSGSKHSTLSLSRLVAYAMVPAVVALGLMNWSQPLHWLDPASAPQTTEQAVTSPEALDDLIRQMSPQQDDDSATSPMETDTRRTAKQGTGAGPVHFQWVRRDH